MRYLAIALLLTPGCLFWYPPYGPKNIALVDVFRGQYGSAFYRSELLPDLRDVHGPRIEKARKLTALRDNLRLETESRQREESAREWKEALIIRENQRRAYRQLAQRQGPDTNLLRTPPERSYEDLLRQDYADGLMEQDKSDDPQDVF